VLTVLAWVVATGAVALALRALGGRRVWDALAGTSVPWLLARWRRTSASSRLWAWQTWLLCRGARARATGACSRSRRSPRRRPTRSPALLGHAAGVALLAERAGVGSAAALAVLTQHQVVEGLAKLAMLGAAALAAPLPPWMRASLVGSPAAWSPVGAVTFIACARAPRRRARRAGGTSRRRRPAGPRARLRRALGRGARRAALAAAVRARAGLRAADEGSEGLGWVAVERAFVGRAPDALPATLGDRTPVLALAAVNLASALSASPGNVGLYEAAAAATYRQAGVATDVALALGVAGHVCYLAAMVGTGYVLLTARQVVAAARRRRGG
jgi:hypothetical protein